MGLACSKCARAEPVPPPVPSKRRGGGDKDCLDPFMRDLMRRSLAYATTGSCPENPQPTPQPQASPRDAPLGRTRRGGGSGSRHQHRLPSPAGAGSGTNDGGSRWMDQGQAHLLFKRSHSKSSHSAASSHHHQSRAHLVGGTRSASASTNALASASLAPSGRILAPPSTVVHYPTRLVVRRRAVRPNLEEGSSGTHIYAVRFPRDQPLKREMAARQTQEQYPHRPPQASESSSKSDPPSASSKSVSPSPRTTNHRMVPPKHLLLDSAAWLPTQSSPPPSRSATASAGAAAGAATASPDPRPTSASSSASQSSSSESSLQHVQVDQLFLRETLLEEPKYKISEWVTVSSEHHVYVVDTGLSALDCDDLIEVTEQACRGQYAAYTYAKQTLGCREFPSLAVAARDVVHSVVHAIYTRFAEDGAAARLLLDDREPHVVKYDVTKKERQKLDMHTDKSEWTFLIALSNGCGLDYDGGGTYFECLDATVHVQRGQALVFPGRLRHCGQRITSGLRFLLVGFLVDKTASGKTVGGSNSATGPPGAGAVAADLDPSLLAHVANVP